MTILYSTTATTIAGRHGKASLSDSEEKFTLDLPKEIGGQGAGFNPEQLFAVGYSACFGGALENRAKDMGLEIGESNISVQVNLEKQPDGFGLSAEIDVHLDSPQAEELVKVTHAFCPYSKATAGNIRHIIKLNGKIIIED